MTKKNLHTPTKVEYEYFLTRLTWRYLLKIDACCHFTLRHLFTCSLVFQLLQSRVYIVHRIVSSPLFSFSQLTVFVCFVVFLISLRQREWQTGDDTMREATHTRTARAGTRATLTAGVMITMRAEDATRSQGTQIWEALPVTGGPNTADRGTWHLLLMRRHLLITLKDPRGCKGPTTRKEITLTTADIRAFWFHTKLLLLLLSENLIPHFTVSMLPLLQVHRDDSVSHRWESLWEATQTSSV